MCSVIFVVVIFAIKMIVMLRGTCSAGKTTICEKVRLQEGRWRVIDLDEIYMNKVVELAACFFRQEFETLADVISPHNLYHAIKRNETHTSSEEALKALSTIHITLNGPAGKSFQTTLWIQLEGLLIEQIESALHEGKDVLMDTWLPRNGFIEAYFKDRKILNVLVYTSLPTSFYFLQKRNEEAFQSDDLSKRRYFGQLFSSFHELYQVTREKNSCTLSEHTKAELESIFEKGSHRVVQNWEETSEGTFTQNEINLLELDKLKRAFIPYEASAQDLLFLEPRDHGDLIVSSKNKSPEEVVALLLEQLDSMHSLHTP